MSRRKTVLLDLSFTQSKIKEMCRSNTVFCERMGRNNQTSWVTEWKRGKNLPSPEEAARMCVILQVRPEEILTEPEDIELVSSLLESQKEKPIPKDEDGLTPAQKEAWAMLQRMDDETLVKFIRIAKAMIGE